jgi:DNA topoisomerase III
MSSNGKWLVIAEKPSVAADIAKALGGFDKKADHYESDKFCVAWAVGHLVELLSPEDIDVKFKRWLLQDLPILPEKFEYKAKDGQKDRLEHIKALAKRKDTVGFINACDAGREGELIFREVFDYSGESKPTQRLWLQSMTKDSILKGFGSLRDGKEFNPLGDAARCRAESDWLIGMNGTRAITRRLRPKAAKGSSWSVGRVQTPTLALVVKREMEILRHRPEPYWSIEGRFSTPTHDYSGQWFDPSFKRTEQSEEDSAVREKEDRIFSKEIFDKVTKDLEANKASAKASETRKESKEIAPQLFDLTTLQREANRKFGMPASRTLQAAQRLYEKHKVLTYPRTDSKYLPEDYTSHCDGMIEKLVSLSGSLGSSAKKIKKSGLLNKNRIFNDKMISDHFAIIPTGEFSDKLEGDDARIYELVLKRFLAAFMSHAIWAKVERITVVGSQSFRTRVQDLQEPGWREAYGLDSEEESKLPKLNEKDPNGSAQVQVLGSDVSEIATRPAPRLSEARLLGLMENCGKTVEQENFAEALSEKGIGTPATRADIIENLIIKEYMQRSGRALKATPKGIRLIDVLGRVPVAGLASVELTGEMEHDLKMVEKGTKKRADFMKNMREYAAEIVEKAKSFEYDAIYQNEGLLGACPRCKKGQIREAFWAYKCNNADAKSEAKCEFIIWKDKNQRYIDRSLVQDVLKHKTFGPIEFQTNAGTAYEAMVTVNENGFFLLDEKGVPIETKSLATAEVLQEEEVKLTCLGFAGRLVETEIAYMCEFRVNGEQGLPVAAAVLSGEEPDASKKPAKKPKTAKASTKPAKAPAKPKKEKTLMSRMPKVLCGHVVTFEDYKRFIISGSTPPITDFKSKKGRPFAASLKLKPNGNFEFKFESRKKLLEGEGGVASEPKPKKEKKATSKAKVVKKTPASKS